VQVLQEGLKEERAAVEVHITSERERVQEILQQQGVQRQTQSAVEAQLEITKAEFAGLANEYDGCKQQLQIVKADAKAHLEQLHRQTHALTAFKAEKVVSDAAAENKEKARGQDWEEKMRRAKAEVVVAQAEAKRGGAWRGEAEAMLAENSATIEKLQRQLEQQKQMACQRNLHHQQQLRLFSSQGASDLGGFEGMKSSAKGGGDVDAAALGAANAPPPRPIAASYREAPTPAADTMAAADNAVLGMFLPEVPMVAPPATSEGKSVTGSPPTPGTVATKSKGLQNQIEELHSRIMTRLHQPFDPQLVLTAPPPPAHT
jgi:hypothetical protein